MVSLAALQRNQLTRPSAGWTGPGACNEYLDNAISINTWTMPIQAVKQFHAQSSRQMWDPCQPHYLPSSPQSISSSDGEETQFLTDSHPIFADVTAVLETLPADLYRSHPSVPLTGPEEESNLSRRIQSQWNPVSAEESSLHHVVGQQWEESTGYSFSDMRCNPDGLVHHVQAQQWLSVALLSIHWFNYSALTGTYDVYC